MATINRRRIMRSFRGNRDHIITNIVEYLGDGKLEYRSELYIEMYGDETYRHDIDLTPEILRKLADELEEAKKEALTIALAGIK